MVAATAPHRVLILDAVSLVDHEVLPRELDQAALLFDRDLVAQHADVKGPELQATF